jgi:hypothetical protein
MPSAKLGTLFVHLDRVDKSQQLTQFAMCLVVEIKYDNGTELHKLAINDCVLNGWINWDQFDIVKYIILNFESACKAKMVSKPTANAEFSLSSGKGKAILRLLRSYQKERCACLKAKVNCNSKCHPGSKIGLNL